MTDLSTINTDDLFAELHRRNIYPVITISDIDILEHAAEANAKITEEAAAGAAHFLFWEYDFGPEFQSLVEAGIERAVELSPELQGK